MMTDRSADPPPLARTPASVVVPFFGDREAAAALAARLANLERGPLDEVIVADNTPTHTFAGLGAERDGLVAVVAEAERSSYHARNVGAERASGEWLIFIDSDCAPPATLIDDFLGTTVDADVAVIAGDIVPAAGQAGLLPEWAASREILSQERSLAREPAAAATANLAVRRAAWEAVGGFQEGIRSGGDYEFCWRVADAGHRIEFRRGAAVEHLHRETLRGIVRQMARYAAGNAWQRRRRRGVVARPRVVVPLARSVAGAGFFMLTLRPRRAGMKLVDGLAAVAQGVGWLLSNRVSTDAPRTAPGDPARRLVVVTDRFPVPSETFITAEIDAMRALGWSVRIEALVRPDRPTLGATRDLRPDYLEDEGTASRLRSLLWAIARHPLRSLDDIRFRRRFAAVERTPLRAVTPIARRLAAGGDRHLHAHFAARASVRALRAGRLAGVPVSIAAHGHEVFATPKALRAKVGAAAFVAAPCEYTARHLREVAGGSGRVEVVVMGVDGERFRRARPYPGGRAVAAIGRLVEKKGFAVLIDAVALLERDRPIDRLEIAGEGPLLSALSARVAAAGLEGRIRMLGALDRDAVLELLERSDVLAVPCVVAPDGDRDAMPVVAKEALAMEVPVVGTDEVGLPEVIAPGWGRLAPPGDPSALAAALGELLALPADIRAEMGAAGREFVLGRFDVESQARRLERLIESLDGHIPVAAARDDQPARLRSNT